MCQWCQRSVNTRAIYTLAFKIVQDLVSTRIKHTFMKDVISV